MNPLRQRRLAAATVRNLEAGIQLASDAPLISWWYVDVAALTVGRQRAASSLGPFQSEAAAQAAARHEVPPVWDEGDRCARCNAGFGMLRRRHHCRNCGYSMCKSCTKYWPKAALPPTFVDGESFASVRVCLGCDAAAMAMRAALLGGDVEAVTQAYADGTANINLRCFVPPAGENQPAILLPVHLAAAADSLLTLRGAALPSRWPKGALSREAGQNRPTRRHRGPCRRLYAMAHHGR